MNEEIRSRSGDARNDQERSAATQQGLTERLRDAEAELDELRTATETLEREVAVMRADLERLRLESERAAGSRLP